VGKHVTAEQVDVFQAQLMGHRTKMQRGEQIADAVRAYSMRHLCGQTRYA
jgi:hypothetical protein